MMGRRLRIFLLDSFLSVMGSSHCHRLQRDEWSQLAKVSQNYCRSETAMVLKTCQLLLIFLKTALACNGDGAFCS